MVENGSPYSIVLPVCNEARILSRTVPAVLAAAGNDRAEIVYVCNGCTDGSADLLRAHLGSRATIIELPLGNKTEALNAGDAVVTAFPRFYLDADIVLAPGSLGQLAAAFQDDAIELVAPQLRYDTNGISRIARLVADMSEALPHGQNGGFHCCLGLSRAGRDRWGAFPDVIGDDIFVEAIIPKERQRILSEVVALVRTPDTFWTWVRVRARWRDGERQLEAMGLHVVRTRGQTSRLLAALVHRRTFFEAACYLSVRLLAEVITHLPRRYRSGWFSVGGGNLRR